MMRNLYLRTSFTMYAAAPGGAPPRRISDYKIQKKFCARRA